ncbi:MAG: hypothetical protein Q9161_008785 [Pseudevernia consocians]
MSYTPPRGPCSSKTSLVTTCPCHRFMIHPLKASTSFDCDGCGHHASFHRMESREEEEVVRRWKGEEKEEEEERGKGRERGMMGEGGREREEMVMMEGLVVVGSKKSKRRRLVEGVERERDVVEVLEGEGDEEVLVTAGRKRKGRG